MFTFNSKSETIFGRNKLKTYDALENLKPVKSKIKILMYM